MARVRVDSHVIERLASGWEAAPAPPADERRPDQLEALDWQPAAVPGTAAGALRTAGRWRPHDVRDFDAEEWWFRTRFPADSARPDEEVALRFDGLATLAEVYLNGEPIVASESMFASHSVVLGSRLEAVNELAIRFRALTPQLREPRTPRARWRTQVVSDGNLRFYRTMLLGRAPGFAPGPAAVGPWRPVWLERRRRLAVEALMLRPRLDGPTGVLAVRARLRSLDGTRLRSARVHLSGPAGEIVAPLTLTAAGDEAIAVGEAAVPEAPRWWPHSHGCPDLHTVELVVEGDGAPVRIAGGRVGFRELRAGADVDHDVEHDGLDLHINGVRVFCRGAVWTPADPVGLAPAPADLRRSLERVLDAGMNMLRVPGTACYEEELFYDLCDELGILVWQDFMFSNFDYPIGDDAFRAAVTGEVDQVLAAIGGRPSLAVLCGNSEVEQQVAMLGLDPALGRGELFGELLPALVGEAGLDAAFVSSSPCGGDMPFRPNHGIAHYYEVGGFFHPVTDARRADVRFAAECLPLANVPDDEALGELFPTSAPAVHDPRWKAGVPRDVGQSWDFDDVRDFYLAELFGLDPVVLRRAAPDHYIALSRAVSGEVMAEVMGEWRRAVGRCGGALVLWLRDLVAGAGWGVLDSRGEPKTAYHYLRRALAPLALWMTDEGVGGIDVHLANDRPVPFSGRLRVALYRDFEVAVGEASEAIDLAAHSQTRRGVEEVLGRFVDVAWAHRFGPPGQDVVVASLEHVAGGSADPVSQSFRFPVGRPATAEQSARLGLEAQAESGADGVPLVRLRSRRLAYGVRIRIPGFDPHDDGFSIEPGGERLIRLTPRAPGSPFPGGEVSAANLRGRVRIVPPDGGV